MGINEKKKKKDLKHLLPATDLSSDSVREKKLAAKRVWSWMGFGDVEL
jgi:hypothetical protein